MEIPKYFNNSGTSESRNFTNVNSDKNSEKGVRILSVDRITVEKIVLETCKSRKILLTKSESSRIISEQNNNFSQQSKNPDSRNFLKLKANAKTNSRIFEKNVKAYKNTSKVPILSIRNNSIPLTYKIRIRPVRLTKTSINDSNLNFKNYSRKLPIKFVNEKENFLLNDNKCNLENLLKKETTSNKVLSVECDRKVDFNHNKDRKSPEDIEDKNKNIEAYYRLAKCQYEIEQLQKVLGTKINVDTVQIYKERLPIFDVESVKILPIIDDDYPTKKETEKQFDKSFLNKLKLCTKLQIEENSLLETNLDQSIEPETDRVFDTVEKQKYNKKVGQLENKWHEDLLKDNSEENSSNSSKSYVEQLGSVSSCEYIIKDNDTEKESDLKEVISGKNDFCEEIKLEEVNLISDLNKNINYDNLILFAMEPCSSKSPKEEKKKKGIRRLLPGIFSPKESRKTPKKDPRERKRRDDKHLPQYQQNGNYSKSIDSMKLNEDIRRNVTSDPNMIEDRIHDMKQNIFPLQGIITSTPDHFLQTESNYSQTRHASRHYDANNSSYNFVSPETEWIEQNIISGSPDMRQLKNSRQIETDRHCNLERKHSFQEPIQSCFIRNHGASGRISAPPSERYLIRSRAVHPMDRPLPAIPQRMQFVTDNQQDIRNCPRVIQEVNYHENRSEFYDNNSIKRMETHRNQFIDTNINQTQSTVQVHQSRQIYSDDKSIRAPKYSPSFSQKSGDYADSSYTPNSSQKSGFSPTSSKSGEYYLNSPHASSHTSPSNSSGDKCEPDLQTSDSFSRSNEEVLYDDNLKRMNIKEPKRLSPKGNQEIPPPSKSSPIIPVFSNFIKAHANIETISKDESFNDKEVREITNKKLDTSLKDEVFEDIRNKETLVRIKGKNIEDVEAKENYENIEDHENYFQDIRIKEKNFEDRRIEKENLEVLPPNIIQSPDRIKRVTSPLIIIPPISPILGLNNMLSNNSQGILKETNQKAMSPLPYQEVKLKVPEPIKNINQNLLSPRKAQPSDQILIASPKRDIIYDSPKSHPIIKSECPDSPIPIVDSPSQALNTKQSLKHIVAERAICLRSPDNQETIIESHKSPEINKEESREIENISLKEESLNNPYSESSKQFQNQNSIYIQRSQPVERNVQTLNSSDSSSCAKNSESVEPLYSGSRITHNQAINTNSPKMQSPKQEINIYEPQQQTTKLMSPSKKQTMHHLETYFWQQKALDAQRKNVNSPTIIKHQPQIHQDAPPEMRDAMYWQKLKKLDEEQQRKFFEQNQRDERNDPIYWKKKLQTSPTRKVHGSAPSLFQQTCSSIPVQEGIYWENKGQRAQDNVVGKPPIMGQKVQNQPVLVVRPQPVTQERSPKIIIKSSTVEQEVNRCQSASPRFLINDDFRNTKSPGFDSNNDKGFSRVPNKDKGNSSLVRKPQTPSIYEEEIDVDKRPPPPIFKRGSLISNSNSSIEYGTMGQKRVSFSNQTNCPTTIGYGKWPTKHGMAPEPPTRKNKENEIRSPQHIIDSTKIYGNVGQSSTSDIYSGHPSNIPVYQKNCKVNNNLKNIDCEYDANKPLPPPPPRDTTSWSLRRTASLRETSRSPKVEAVQLKNDVTRKWSGLSESESGSEAGEVQRIFHRPEEEWNPDGKGRQGNDIGGTGRTEGEGANDLSRCGSGGGGGGFGGGTRGSSISGSGGGSRSRDEPRRHTLSGDHQPSLHHQFNSTQQIHPLHPHHLPTAHSQYGTLTGRHTMDLEMGTKSRQRKAPLPRGYPPPSTAMLFDDDPGIMSEVETSSTGFRRGGKQRSSLPVVRTPSKTLERPLGLVFLQYRSETKRALLPNEITSIDTVKALFVRSFPKQLTMEYLDSPHVKVYIHDSSKDMFYELEDLRYRSHLRDIRDRSVLRLFESSDGMPGPLGPAGGAGLPPHWEDQSYFSEPEFDSEFQHQHIHKSKNVKNSSGNYYIGGSSTLPRGGSLLRAYSPAAASSVGPNSTPTQAKTLTTPGGGVAPAKPLRSYQSGSSRFSRDSSVSLYSIPDRIHGEGGYMSSPERGSGSGPGRYPPVPYSGASSYEDPYYSQYSGTVTPVIDEEASDTELLEESYSLYGVKPSGRPPSGPLARSPFPPGAPTIPPVGPRDDVTRLRVENMERQLANLTGIVQKALIHPQHTSPSPRDYLQIPAGREPYTRTQGAGDEFDKQSSSSSASLPDKSVSFEKSVSFSDEPPDMNSPKQHSPQHAADTKPTKPAIKSSTLPRMSSQERERERHKPTPPPKPVALTTGQYVYGDLTLAPEMYNQLRVLQKKAKDLNQEKRNLRRMAQAQSHTVRESIRDAYITIRAMLMSLGENALTAGDTEKLRLSREEDLYKQEMLWLEKDLTGLESTVEELRGNVINRKTRVNMSDVENMALILNKASKTVADLKVRFPSLQEGMKGLLSSEMEKVMREEKFLKEEPDRLESVLKRCKKLTGTLVTLKRLASVQEQRLPNAGSVDVEETPPITPTSTQHSKTTAPVPAERTIVGSTSIIGGGAHVTDSSTPNQQRPENALDALLDELQTFSRPASQLSQASNSSHHHHNHPPTLADLGRSASHIIQTNSRAPNISDIGRKGSIDSTTNLPILTTNNSNSNNNTLRRLHSYPSSSDTDTSPPIARLQVSNDNSNNITTPQKPPVPERNAELLQIATARRVPPPPPPRTSSRSPLASPTSPQLPPRNPTTTLTTTTIVGGGTLRRTRNNGKPPMALPTNTNSDEQNQQQQPANNIVSTSNSSSCESVNSQEGIQNKKGRHEQLEQRHQELLRRQKVLQEQYTRLQQFQNAPPAPSDLLKKTGSESNLLAKMGLGMSTTTTTNSGSLTSLLATKSNSEPNSNNSQQNNIQNANQTTTNKIYETDIL
ncbi:uncharacterized protein LOC127282887 isoform X4 [Leptopilina boulardi]|uniref:uncharacterized protein LOC127282887 isoform X4 n=1 Tax=Leptopilina boulardi TaxID=63433 RepID=UPI0021F5C389|nr:uncharacterized protein LOC127282887 isoform X4 [Leptopilina boulardi]